MPPKRRTSTKRSTKTSTKRSAKRRKADASQFIESEAKADSCDEDSPTEDEEDQRERSQKDDSPSEEEISQSTHRALDNLREPDTTPTLSEVVASLGSRSGGVDRQSHTRDNDHDDEEDNDRDEEEDAENGESSTRERTSPYFPLGLAESEEEPTRFKFELFLFDTLSLPRGLFPEDERDAKQFASIAECRSYCERFVTERKRQLLHSKVQAVDLRSLLSKEEMFKTSGQAVHNIATGNTTHDSNLANVRVDMFGNVMIWNAPHWSDISPQFTHGFPRSLIKESHRGMFKENLTVAARISNQAIRSLSVGDVASFISQKMVKGLGLTQSELILARTSALKYAGRGEKPSRLIDTMLRFGVDFLSMKPLTTQQVQDFRGTSSLHWEKILLEVPQENPTEGESSSTESGDGDELDVPESWDFRSECGDFMPGPASPDFSNSVEEHVSRLLTCYLSTTVEKEINQPPRETQPHARRSSGQRRKQKQTKTAAPAPAPGPASVTSPVTDENPAAGDARAALEAVDGIVVRRIPTDDSLKRLRQYLSNNQPLQAQQVTVLEGSHEPLQRFQASYRANRSAEVKQAKTQLWDACKADCMCEAESSTRSSQGTQPGENCPYCQATDSGAEIGDETGKCRNEECRVCELVDHCEVVSLELVGVNKNARLTAMLQFSKYLAHVLNSGDIPEARMANITSALCSLLCCRQTKLRNVANTGFLAELCPNLVHVQLNKGWGDLWSNLSKIGSAVGHHQSLQSQLAALIFIREKCLPQAENNWHYYLQSGNSAAEQEVREDVFHGCFEQDDNSANNCG